MPPTKRCRSCDLVKPLAEFGRNAARKDGLHYYCRPCVSARTQAWRKANPDKARAQKRRWSARRTTEQRRLERAAALERNPDLRCEEYRRALEKHGRESLQARWREWAAANAEHVRAYGRLWRLANPEKCTEYARRYRYAHDPEGSRARARNPGSRDELTAEYVEVLASDPCSYCGGPGGTIDHIDALVVGGSNHWTNYTSACRSCNGGKRERDLLTCLLSRSARGRSSTPSTRRGTPDEASC